MRLVLGRLLDDIVRMETYLQEHCDDILYTSVRPPQLTDKPLEGECVYFGVGNILSVVVRLCYVYDRIYLRHIPLPYFVDKPMRWEESYFVADGSHSTPRANVATFMLDIIEKEELHKKMVAIAL